MGRKLFIRTDVPLGKDRAKRRTRIELASSAWKAEALPLSYRRVGEPPPACDSRPLDSLPESVRMRSSHGEWRSLVAHSAGGRAVAGSNPVSPIRGVSGTDRVRSGHGRPIWPGKRIEAVRRATWQLSRPASGCSARGTRLSWLGEIVAQSAKYWERTRYEHAPSCLQCSLNDGDAGDLHIETSAGANLLTNSSRRFPRSGRRRLMITSRSTSTDEHPMRHRRSSRSAPRSKASCAS
jgi:hypothetical protein